MSDQNLDYPAIRRRVAKGVSRQRWIYRLIFLCFHVLAFAASMLVMWGHVAMNASLRAILFDSGSGASIIVIVPTLVWAFMLLCHFALFYTETDVAEKEIREKLILREIGEDILRTGLYEGGPSEKPKRRAVEAEVRRMLLSDDGELEPADADEDRPEKTERATRTGASKG